MRLKDSRLNTEYLVCAPPHEVLLSLHEYWISRANKREFLPDKIVDAHCETSLLARSSRPVDIALALVGSPETVEMVLERNGNGDEDEAVLLAALRNPIAASRLLGPYEWLADRLPWIAAHGDLDHLEALFQNQNVSHEVFDAACMRSRTSPPVSTAVNESCGRFANGAASALFDRP